MKLFSTLCALVAVAGLAAAEEKKFDASKMEGKWKMVSGTKSGDKLEGKSLEGEVTVDKEKFTIKGGDMTHVMAFKLDTSKSPVQIDMEGKEGPSQGFKAEGIIQLDGDKLTLAYALPEGKRPEKFESAKDSKTMLIVMERVK
ncbi:MAG TPA: TIGR03067 domain-containing protein [Gemmataceae bacterium]|nr:TIGR03067 domain-containing protein [Gemmataceae bacterium]